MGRPVGDVMGVPVSRATRPLARRNCGLPSCSQSAMTVVGLGQLALGDVEAPGGQGRAELHEHGPEVDLDGEGVVGAGAGHHRDDGDTDEDRWC